MTSKTDDVRIVREWVEAARRVATPTKCLLRYVPLSETELNAIEALISPAPAGVAGWIVGNSQSDRWRAWDQGNPIWVDDPAKATRYARREDAEAVHAEDEDAWCIKLYAALSAAEPAPVALDERAAEEAVAWRETFIVDEEDGPAVGIVIDLPDGSQIWTGECSAQLLEDADAREESPEASGQYLIVAARGEPTRVVAQVATVDDGIGLARAIAGHAPSPPSAAQDDRLRKARGALEVANSHIQHMAAWISKTNASDTPLHGYSFEALGEDKWIIDQALAALNPEAAK